MGGELWPMMTERESQDGGRAGAAFGAEGQSARTESAAPPARRMEVWVWCLNNQREICVAACQPEGKYRHLAPAVLASGELPPSLPPYAEFLDWPGSAKLALLYLMAHYQDWLAKRE
jgi:hypothetical protein